MSVLGEKVLEVGLERVVSEIEAEVVRNPAATSTTIAFAAMQGFAEALSDAGYRLLPPGMVHIPLSAPEARGVVLVGQRYIDDNTEASNVR